MQPDAVFALEWLWVVWTRGGTIAAALCCVWAFWRGGTTERIAAAIIGAGWSLTLLLAKDGEGPGHVVAAVDVIVFLLFLGLAIWSRRLWVFVLAACTLNSVFVHFAKFLSQYGLYSFSTATGFWGGWALLICLAWGVIDHRLRLKRSQTLARPGSDQDSL